MVETKEKVVPGTIQVTTPVEVVPGTLEPPTKKPTKKVGGVLPTPRVGPVLGGLKLPERMPVLETPEEIEAWKIGEIGKLQAQEQSLRSALRESYEKVMESYERGAVVPGVVVGSPPTAYEEVLKKLRGAVTFGELKIELLSRGIRDVEGWIKKARETVELDTGEVVSKMHYDKLSPVQQTVLNKVGVEEFQKKVGEVVESLKEQGFVTKEGSIDVVKAVKAHKYSELQMVGLSRSDIGDVIDAIRKQRKEAVERQIEAYREREKRKEEGEVEAVGVPLSLPRAFSFADIAAKLKEVEPYKTPDGGYNVVAAIEGGVSEGVMSTLFAEAYLNPAYKFVDAKIVLEPYLTDEGGYDVVKAIEDGISEDTLSTLFSEDSLSGAHEIVDAKEVMKPYKTDEGYDVVAAIEADVPSETLTTLFSEDAIAEAQVVVDAKVEMQPYLTDDGYDIVSAIEAEVPAETLSVLFSEDVIADAQIVVDAKVVMEPYLTDEGGYDLVKAIQEEVSSEVLSALFPEDVIVNAQITVDALGVVEPYKIITDEGVSYDLVGAVASDEVSPEVLSVLFTPEEISGAQTFIAENVQLSTGEWVPKADFEAMPVEEQTKLMELGIEQYTIQWEAAHVQAADGQWISKEDFAEMTPQMQTIVLQQGLGAISTEGLTAEQKFVKYVDWGLIPEGSEYAGEQEGEPVYYTPEQIPTVQALETLEPYTDEGGKIDYYKALKEGISIDVLAAVGISDEDIAGAQNIISAESTLEPYTTEQGIDVLSALSEGISVDVLRTVGISEDVISNAELVVPYVSEGSIDIAAALDAGITPDTLAFAGIEVSEEDYSAYQTAKADLDLAKSELEGIELPEYMYWPSSGLQELREEYEIALAKIDAKQKAYDGALHEIMRPYLTYDIEGKQYSATEWDNMTPGQQLEILLGREPDPQEYRAYYMEVNRYQVRLEYLPPLEHGLELYGTSYPAGHQFAKSWRESYESEYGTIGVGKTMIWAGSIFVPPVRALGPAGIGEITPMEWGIGALNLATLIAPIPKVGMLVKVPIRYAGKALGGLETVVVPFKIPSRAVTYPLERIGTVRARVPSFMKEVEFRPYVSQLFEKLAHVEPPVVHLPGGGLLRVTPSGLQKVLGPAVAHATRDYPAFTGSTFTVKSPLFTGPWLYTKLILGSRRGILPTKPGGIFVRLTQPLRQYPRAIEAQPTIWELRGLAAPFLRSGQAIGRFPLYKRWVTTKPGGAPALELESIYGVGTKLFPQASRMAYTRVGMTKIPLRLYTEEVGFVRPITFRELMGFKLEGLKRIFGWKGVGKPAGVLEVEWPTMPLKPGRTVKYKLEGDVFNEYGNIIETASSDVHPVVGGLIRRRVTGVVIDKQGRLLLVTDKMEPKGFFDLPGGRIDPLGKFGKTPGEPGISIEGALHGQVKSEVGFGVYNSEMFPPYMGKVNIHSLPGSYVVKASPKSTVINIRKYTPKGKPSELKDAIWWDGQTEIKVSPATYDIIKGLADSGILKVDMSKVSIHKIAPRELLVTRDLNWGVKLVQELKAPKVTGEPGYPPGYVREPYTIFDISDEMYGAIAERAIPVQRLALEVGEQALVSTLPYTVTTAGRLTAAARADAFMGGFRVPFASLVNVRLMPAVPEELVRIPLVAVDRKPVVGEPVPIRVTPVGPRDLRITPVVPTRLTPVVPIRYERGVPVAPGERRFPPVLGEPILPRVPYFPEHRIPGYPYPHRPYPYPYEYRPLPPTHPGWPHFVPYPPGRGLPPIPTRKWPVLGVYPRVIAPWIPPYLEGRAEEAREVFVNLETRVKPVGSGRAEPRSGHYSPGTVVEVTAVPFEGTRFVRWEGDISGRQNPAEVIMDTNKTVTAVFSGRPEPKMMELPGLALFMPTPLEPVEELERPRRIIKKKRIPLAGRRMVPVSVYKEVR